MFASCGHYATGESVYSGGLWIIPVICLLGALKFWYDTYKAIHSGSKQQVPGGGTKYSDENVKFYRVGRFWLGAALFVAMIVSIILINGDK